MFFNKSLKDVTYNDVQEFCKGKIKENEVLDYKEDFPSTLEKILAAFANTYGGLIIIGVAEDDGKPVDEPLGIPFHNGLEEKVTNIILSNISPAIFPDIQVCEPVNERTFVLIQVSQSRNTPHAIENNTKVYLRTGSVTQPERLANLNELHWLSSNRQSSTTFRHDLISDATDRYYALVNTLKTPIEFAELVMYCVPIYPAYEKGNIEKVKSNIHNFNVTGIQGSIFPDVARGSFKTSKDSIYLFLDKNLSHIHTTQYTVISSFGLVMHIGEIGRSVKEGEGLVYKIIYMEWVTEAYINLLTFYRKIQNELRVWGDYLVHLSISKTTGSTPIPIVSQPYMSVGDFEKFYDKSYTYHGSITNKVFTDEAAYKQEIKEFIIDLHWAFGIPADSSVIDKWIENKVKW